MSSTRRPMASERPLRRWVACSALAGTVALFAAPCLAQGGTETYRFDARSLFVGNLIGEIRIEGHDGSEFVAEVTVAGKDAQRLAPAIQTREGTRARLEIKFPVDRERRYVYPELGRGSTSIQASRRERDSGWLRELISALTAERIEVAGQGSGAEVWADVTIRVPRGGVLELEHGVGEASASGVEGELTLDLISGQISAERISGSVVVSTGSGRVDLADIEGELEVDTGSGDVTIARADSPRLFVDTGSGEVDLSEVRSRSLEVDTGSGAVTAESVAADAARIDTGSGAVRLTLAEMGAGPFEIDTGSGSITLVVPSYASAELEADTGSGGIDVDLRDYETLHRERDELRIRLGRGEASVRLDTGSGSIRVSSTD